MCKSAPQYRRYGIEIGVTLTQDARSGSVFSLVAGSKFGIRLENAPSLALVFLHGFGICVSWIVASPMSFDRLRMLCEISDPARGYLAFIHEWDSKRASLRVNLADIPTLLLDFKNRKQEPYAPNPEITRVDQVPAVRLANACESVSNLVYSMAEIAARFANKVTPAFPASFNQLRKKARKGNFDETIVAALGDLQWYEKVHEIRTEWAHYSSPFVGTRGDEPSIVLRSFRSKDNRVHFATRVAFTVDELCQWAQSAFRTIEGFADYLFRFHLLHSFDFDKVIGQPVRDCHGFPVVKDGRIETEEMTIADFMFRNKILERCADIERWSQELGVSVDSLREGLKDVKGMTGKLKDGTVVENGFYSESAVQHVIAGLVGPAGHVGARDSSSR